MSKKKKKSKTSDGCKTCPAYRQTQLIADPKNGTYWGSFCLIASNSIITSFMSIRRTGNSAEHETPILAKATRHSLMLVSMTLVPSLLIGTSKRESTISVISSGIAI